MARIFEKFVLGYELLGENDATRQFQKEFLPSDGLDLDEQFLDFRVDAGLFLSDLAGASSAHINRVTYSLVMFEEDAPLSGLGNVYKEVGITAQLDDSPDRVTVWIPAPRSLLMVGNSDNSGVVDISDTLVIDYVQNFVNDGTHRGTVSDGEQFQDPPNIVAGKLRTVRSGKRY